MRLLFCTGSSASYMAPPQLADEQIICGPDWPDAEIGGYVTALNTPLGEFDLAAVAKRIPSDQQPDVVVCLVDASWRLMPRNLRIFRCPKVLLIADTHHLNTPISGMIRYAESEPFDRIVFLYDRHHWDFFAAAGLKQLYWFPGLTFPHDDKAVAGARNSAPREPKIAFVGQTGICHPRRTSLLSQLNAHQIPLAAEAVSQREGLAIYGSSLIGFNSSLNGDLNLRIFEIIASGAMLLTDELAPTSGLNDLWQSGRELVTYATPLELVEKARHAVSHPEETKAIGAAGARWFDEHFSAQARRVAFQKLVFDGVAPAPFARPMAQAVSVAPVSASLSPRLISGYEYLQELHRTLDRVVVVLDESVPEAFAQSCATLPRLTVRRGMPAAGTRVDFLVVGRQNFNSAGLASAIHVWSWDEAANDRVALMRRCSSMGLSLVNPTSLIFSRHGVCTHTNEGALALVSLEQGSYDDAYALAEIELKKNARSVDAWLVMLDLAQEKGNAAMAQLSLGKLRAIVPHHPRVRQLAAATVPHQPKRTKRLLRVARSLLERQRWAEAGKFAREALTLEPRSAEAHFVIGCTAAHGPEPEQAIAVLGRATELNPTCVDYWRELARVLRRLGRNADALAAMIHVVSLKPDDLDLQLALAEVALEIGHGAIACTALERAAALSPSHSLTARWMPLARQLRQDCRYDDPRDLLLTHVEVTRMQGTGVLIERFFPDASTFVTVRSRSLYKGAVNFGGVHFSMDLPGLDEASRRAILERLLGAYHFRRILSVPFFASDFMHAAAAREITGAPLCTYVMDDQVLHSREVPAELARRVFAASDVRLAISPEMIVEYTERFDCSFGLLPPVVTTRSNEVPNDWTAARGSPRHCVMVGNIWSAKQFEQLRTFSRSAQLKIDWFGNSKVAWLPQDQRTLEADGIYCQGFLPEEKLAHRLANYPFVLIPSGRLDGTEDNEWLTRLSLPSRMVFILTKTFTPMLVLGSAKTAAARFVNQFGLGLCSNFESPEAKERIAEITATGRRAEMTANARRIALSFLMPDCGQWIWHSLAAKAPQPTPFDALYSNLARTQTSPLGLAQPGNGSESLTASTIACPGDRDVLPLLESKNEESDCFTDSGDAFGSPHIRGILKQLFDPKFAHVEITLETNGQLITPRFWEELEPLRARFLDITISIDGATPETYEGLRRGSTWEKLLRTMAMLEQARGTGVIRRLMVNMAVQQQNFLEMRPLLELCKGWTVDGIRFHRIQQSGNIFPGAFMNSDVANPQHPNYPELMAELAHPAFADPIVEQYDMHAMIRQAQDAAPAAANSQCDEAPLISI